MTKAWAFRFAIPMAMVGVCMVGAQQKPSGLSFFITSAGSGKGADFGGVEGADKHCQQEPEHHLQDDRGGGKHEGVAERGPECRIAEQP